LLNQGYGTQESGVRQSIAVLNLANNQLRDFPDDRLRGDEKVTRQSYFIGLAFSSDGKHLYASMSSTTEGGIAVYSFNDGIVTPERFITIPPQKVPQGKKVTFETAPAGTVSPYPAGIALLPEVNGDRLLVADNLSDNVVLLDALSGKILRTFDLSTSKYVPAAYPYTVIANREGSRAWVTLWMGHRSMNSM
jgi:DNA-binding beta-propeller fold protein YncE